MTDEARNAKRQYEREWRKKNPEKVQAIRDRYWANVARKTIQNDSEEYRKQGDSA